MIPPSSEPSPDPDQIEHALESGHVSPEQARSGFFTRQQAVDETLRGLAELQPPDPEPSITSTWQHTVRYASLQQDLNDEGAAAAESILSGHATPREVQIWEREAGRHPVLAAAARRAARMDRTLAQLPEAAGLQVPPLVLLEFRKTLAALQAPAPGPAVKRGGWRLWFTEHPVILSMAAGAAAAVAVAALNPTWTIQPPSAPGGGMAVVAPDKSSSGSGPVAAPEAGPPVPERAPTPSPAPDPVQAPVPVSPLELIAKTPAPPPEPATTPPASAEEPETSPEPPPPPGSMEALRPIYLAQLTGGMTRLGGQEGILRSGQESTVGTDLQVVFRNVRSSDPKDAGNEQFAALAAALNDPALADEPYFIIEDHSHNDIDVSIRRAEAVCRILTKYGVLPSRMRPGGKGRFELRPGDNRDAQTSRITVRPASVLAQARATGYIDRLGRDFPPMR